MVYRLTAECFWSTGPDPYATFGYDFTFLYTCHSPGNAHEGLAIAPANESRHVSSVSLWVVYSATIRVTLSRKSY